VKFELTILGCGSAVPTLQRNAAAQVLNVLERYFLIDCGEGTQQQLRRFRVPYNKINHIFISHLHGDHFFGLIGLLSSFSLQNRRAELHIYSDKRLQEIIEFQLKVMNSRLNYPLIFHHLDREPGLIYEDRMMTVHAFPLKHRYEAPVTGFLFAEKPRPNHILRDMIDFYQVPVYELNRIKNGADYVTPEGEVIPNARLTRPSAAPRRYAYCSDTIYLPSITEQIKGVDLLFHEATFAEDAAPRAKETFHTTASQAARIARDAEVKKLLIGHFSARYDDEQVLLDEARAVFPDTQLAKETLCISV
jgi:ribonuclease Z